MYLQLIFILFYRLEARCWELLGEFDEHDIYKMVAKNGADERQLFKLFCKAGNEHYKRNTCGNGFDRLLDPSSWNEKKDDSFTSEPVDNNEDDSESDDSDSKHDEL